MKLSDKLRLGDTLKISYTVVDRDNQPTFISESEHKICAMASIIKTDGMYVKLIVTGLEQDLWLKDNEIGGG